MIMLFPNKTRLLWLFILSLFSHIAFAQTAYYVDDSAIGLDNGTSWANAYTSLESALSVATSGDKIYVAAGTYYPSQQYEIFTGAATTGDSRKATFKIPDGVEVYGGFAGTESPIDQSVLNARDFDTNTTILSGDIGTINTRTDNAYHVVFTYQVSSSTIVDGFTIKNGYTGVDDGGGWHNNAGASSSSPTIRNCIFSGNNGRNGGALSNSTTNFGISSPTIINCTFLNNTAYQGGAIYNEGAYDATSSPTLINCVIARNHASSRGGGLYNNANQGTSNPTLTNCTLYANTAGSYGGGMFNDGDNAINPSSCYPKVTNCIFWRNTEPYGALSSWYDLVSAEVTIDYSLIEESETDMYISAFFMLQAEEPLFVDSANNDFRLSACSPAVNTGNNSADGLTSISTDIDGNARIQYTTIDMGAYENDTEVITWNGTSWSNGSGPTGSEGVIIDGTNAPSDFTAACVRFTPSGEMEVGDGETVTITGNFNNNGTFIQTGGNLVFNGTVAQIVAGSNSFTNVTIDNAAGVTFDDPTVITQKLTLNSGSLLNSNGNLTLNSDASNTAYIVNNGGTVSGNVKVERHIKDNSGEAWGQGFSATGYRYIASPINNLTVGGIDGFTPEITDAAVFNSDWNQTMPNAFPNVFMYDETRITASTGNDGEFLKGWFVPTSTSTVLTNGKGFIVNIPTGDLVSLTGTLNDGDIPVAVSKGSQTQSGWTLLGNPYPSPLNLKSFLEDASNSSIIDGTAYVRIPSSRYSGVWASFVASTGISSPSSVTNNLIAPMQSFMVYKTADGSSSVTFKNSHRGDNDFNFMRTKRSNGLLRLEVNANGKSDEVVIYFHEDATSGFDSHFDAHKVQYNPQGYPTFFTEVEGKMLQISGNSLASLDNQQTITPLSLWAEYNGLHEITLTELSEFSEGYTILLEDRFENKMLEMSQGDAYQFTAEKGFQKDRFFVHINQKIKGVEEELAAAGLQLYSHSKTIEFKTEKASQQATIKVFDLSGRQLTQAEVVGSQSLETQLGSGIYVVQLHTEQGIFAKKLLLQ